MQSSTTMVEIVRRQDIEIEGFFPEGTPKTGPNPYSTVRRRRST